MPIPIPQRPSGYRLGKPDAPVQIEMFFDLECPFSKKGWQTMLKVAQVYSPEQLYLILQSMTLGNHRQSWDATKAAIAVAGSDSNKFVDFVGYLFDHQTAFANEAFKDKTQTDWHNLLADYAIDATEWSDKEEFIQLLNSKEIYNQARIPARIAAIRSVWSTPTFFINGAEATELSSKSSLEDWQEKIDSLLQKI
jgi:protein-disulfide isomerase